MYVSPTSVDGYLIRSSPVGLRGGRNRSYSLSQRLSARTDKSGGQDACWPLAGYSNPRNRYVQIAADWPERRSLYGHRAAWILAHGPIPDGLVICHHCDNPRCVNPSHLFLATQGDNIRDAMNKGRFTAWHRSKRRLDGRISSRYAHLVGQDKHVQSEDGAGGLDILNSNQQSVAVVRHGSQSTESACR